MRRTSRRWFSSIAPTTSVRVEATSIPCIVQTRKIVNDSPGTLSLAQGVVHWPPPGEAKQRLKDGCLSAHVNAYGPAEGNPVLRDMLQEKIRAENGLIHSDVMVTAGANQGFVNIVLSLTDHGDGVVLFAPYYFNHKMAVQMSGGNRSLLYGPCKRDTWKPDLDWLARTLDSSRPKLVVIANPCNPTGVVLPPEDVERAARMCAEAGTWLVLDNTYEDFLFDDRVHRCAEGSNILNLFSFSKAYGMMGWRVGYIAYPACDHLARQLLKVQDTVTICPPQLSQEVALGALLAGAPWVAGQVAGLSSNRALVSDALSPLPSVGGGEGAIYYWASLPSDCSDDEAVVEWLVRKHQVCLIPGTACGVEGHVRAAFANLSPEECADASRRLKAGLTELVSDGFGPVEEWLSEHKRPLS